MTISTSPSKRSKGRILKTREIWLVNLDPTIGDEIRKTRLLGQTLRQTSLLVPAPKMLSLVCRRAGRDL